MQINTAEGSMNETATESSSAPAGDQTTPSRDLYPARKIVITPLNYEAVMMEVRELTRRAEALRQQAKAMALENIHRAMEDYGLTVEDIFPAKKRGRPATRARETEGYCLYRDPVSGRVWSGRGRMPQWLRDAIAQGQDKASFLMKN